MKKQTAVEFAVEKLEKLIPSGNQLVIGAILEKAIKMEKEQHGTTWDKAIDAHEKRGHVIARSWCDFDEYYNEIFKK